MLIASVALAAPEDNPSDVSFSKQANLSPQETVSQSREYLSNMQGTLKTVTRLEEEAQRKKDVIRINCIRDKRDKIRANISIADKSMAVLNDAIAKSDTGERQHQFTRLTILNQQTEILGTEARQCIGSDIPIPGTQGVTVEIDPSITKLDPTEGPIPKLEPPPRPIEASPET